MTPETRPLWLLLFLPRFLINAAVLVLTAWLWRPLGTPPLLPHARLKLVTLALTTVPKTVRHILPKPLPKKHLRPGSRGSFDSARTPGCPLRRDGSRGAAACRSAPCTPGCHDRTDRAAPRTQPFHADRTTADVRPLPYQHSSRHHAADSTPTSHAANDRCRQRHGGQQQHRQRQGGFGRNRPGSGSRGRKEPRCRGAIWGRARHGRGWRTAPCGLWC